MSGREDDKIPSPPPEAQEQAWIDVIRKMEEVYTDLIRYEVELEDKNKALEEAQNFITSVLTSVSDILVVSDQKGKVQQVNAAFLDLTGLSESDLLGKPVRSLFASGEDPVQATQINHFLSAQFLTEGRVRDWEVRFKAQGGATEPVALNCSPRFDHRKRPAGMVLIGRPVGELRRAYEALNSAHADLKQAQQHLIQAEKMASIGRLVAGVAHELNNPISFIYGNAHSLAKYRDRLTKYLDAIHKGADGAEREELRQRLRIDRLMADLPDLVEGTLEGAARVSEIVKNLKRLSFHETGRPEPLDLAALLRTAVQWSAKARQGATTRLDLPAAMPVLGHAGQLHQVFVNLMENALDAVADRPQPMVKIEGRDEGTVWRVTVRDNGPGIPAEHLLKVFDPFFTTKPPGKGTGLGLWISYGIIKDHGGQLEAATCDGGGACITVLLPKG